MSDRSVQPHEPTRAHVFGGEALAFRAKAFAAIRGFFAARDFLEVDTPQLVPSPGLDLHLDAFEVIGAGFLATSPEYQMKRLLTLDVERIYQLAHCFRAGEQGHWHNREFMMLEWYRIGDVDAVMQDTEQLVSEVLALGGVTVKTPFIRMTVAEAFERFADTPRERTLDLAANDEDTFFQLLVDRIEPALEGAVFLHDYPASQASLARHKPDDPAVCERFELYVDGVELCNGFGELTDPVQQRQRFELDQLRRRELGKPVYPIDERFVLALEQGLPACAGNALGIDRLIALARRCDRIADVMPFPLERL